MEQLGDTITFFTTFRGRYVYYVWYKDGKKLQNECKAHLQITDINQNDYGMYKRVATASDGSRDCSQFSLEPFSGFNFNRAESVEVELPQNFSIDMRNDSPYSLTASVESGHPARIAPYEPPQQMRHTEYSSRHDLHPPHYHSPQIQPYSPPYVDPVSYHGCHHKDIKKSDYGLYERIATSSDGSKYRSQFSLEPPIFSGVDFNRAESVEVELPPNFQKC